MLKRDSLRLGLLLGFLAPVAGMFAYYLVQFQLFSLKEFFYIISTQKSLLSGIISVSLFANAVIFTLYINTRKDRTARGIFIATRVYAIPVIALKIFG